MGIREFLRIRTQKNLANIPHAQGWYWNISGAGDYEISNNYSGFEKAYREEVWVQRCINLIASCVSCVPLKLYRGEEEVTTHPILKLLADVNPLTMNSSELWKATIIGLKVYGNAYWYLERRGKEEPQEIYWLRPSCVKIMPSTDTDKYIDHYEYIPGTKTAGYRYNPRDIIHFKYFNPDDDYYGLSQLSSVREAISADLYAQAWNKYFFKNSARPDGFFITKSTLTDEQRKMMKKSIESQFKGVSKAHTVAVLEEGMDYKQISTTPKDAEWSELRTACREAICSALGVPPVMVVAFQAATYSTAIEQKKSLWHETIIPELKYLEEVLKWNLVPQFKGAEGLKLQYDLLNVPALQEEASDKYERLFRATGVPFLTPNEARTAIGLPKLKDVKGADELYTPLNMIIGQS